MGKQRLGKFTAHASKQRTHQYTGIDASSSRSVQDPVKDQRQNEKCREMNRFIVLDVDFGEPQIRRKGAKDQESCVSVPIEGCGGDSNERTHLQQRLFGSS